MLDPACIIDFLSELVPLKDPEGGISNDGLISNINDWKGIYFLEPAAAFFLVGVLSELYVLPIVFYVFSCEVDELAKVLEVSAPNPDFLPIIGLYLPFLNFLLDSYNKVWKSNFDSSSSSIRFLRSSSS